jgi:hypothetical protein
MKYWLSAVGAETKNPAYEWSIHVNLLVRARTLLGIGTSQKVSFEELLGRHRTKEQTTGLLREMVIGRIPVRCLRSVAVVARCLVLYVSTGRDGRILGWCDRAVRCRMRIED